MEALIPSFEPVKPAAKDAFGRFDPAAAWDALDAEEQRSIGMIALLLGRAELLLNITDYLDQFPRGETPLVEWASEFEHDLVAILADHTLDFGEPDVSEKFDSLAIGMPTCRRCGCSEHMGCEGGCSWVEGEIDLCSACMPGADR